MTQKVIKVGTSAGVVIPKEMLKAWGLRAGDRVTVELDKKDDRVLLKPVRTPVAQETIAWTEKFLKEYGPALKELANK